MNCPNCKAIDTNNSLVEEFFYCEQCGYAEKKDEAIKIDDKYYAK